MVNGVLTESPETLNPAFPRFDTYTADTTDDEFCDWLQSPADELWPIASPQIGDPIYKQDLGLSSDPDQNCVAKFYTDDETFYFTNASHYALQNLLQKVFTGNLVSILCLFCSFRRSLLSGPRPVNNSSVSVGASAIVSFLGSEPCSGNEILCAVLHIQHRCES